MFDFFINVQFLYKQLKSSYTEQILKLHTIDQITYSIRFMHIKTGKIFTCKIDENFIKNTLKGFNAKDSAQIGLTYAKWEYTINN